VSIREAANVRSRLDDWVINRAHIRHEHPVHYQRRPRVFNYIALNQRGLRKKPRYEFQVLVVVRDHYMQCLLGAMVVDMRQSSVSDLKHRKSRDDRQKGICVLTASVRVCNQGPIDCKAYASWMVLVGRQGRY
jgi:hypothetical protein